MYDNQKELEKQLQEHYKHLRFDHQEIYLSVFSDIHAGHRGFDHKTFQNSLNYIKNIPNFYVFLGGDSANHANKGSKSSQFEENMTPDEQYYGQFEDGKLIRKGLLQYLTPIKDKIIGKIDGNHDGTRAQEFNSMSPNKQFCKEIGIPYFGDLALFQMSVGHNSYTTYHHHISGSGGKRPNVNKLMDIAQGWWFDLIFGEHTHQRHWGYKPYAIIDQKHKKVRVRKQYFVNTNSMVAWSGYAKTKNYGLGLTGFNVVKLSGTKNDHSIQVFEFKEFVDYYESRK
jgi:hypothetical protein